MRDDLLGELRLCDGSIEIRRYKWAQAEELSFCRENYMVSRLLTSRGRKRPFSWRIPCSTYSQTAVQMSVVPPHSPVSVTFEPGEAVVVSCILKPSFFEQTTGIDCWDENHTQLCLGLRSPLIGLIFNRLAHEVYFAAPGSTTVAQAFVTALSVEIGRGIERLHTSRPVGQMAPWQLQQVYATIEQCGTQPPTIEQVAYRCGLSARHLMRAFKASTGLTLHQYSSELRMRRAVAMLTDGDAALKAIAGELGFSSGSAFSAAFRQSHGCTPSEFRRRSRLLRCGRGGGEAGL